MQTQSKCTTTHSYRSTDAIIPNGWYTFFRTFIWILKLTSKLQSTQTKQNWKQPPNPILPVQVNPNQANLVSYPLVPSYPPPQTRWMTLRLKACVISLSLTSWLPSLLLSLCSNLFKMCVLLSWLSSFQNKFLLTSGYLFLLKFLFLFSICYISLLNWI